MLALAGLAVSAPQPPGSTFKIITAAAALQNGVAKTSSSYPVRTAATLSGVALRNAGDESCGGSSVELLRALVQLRLRPARGQARRQAAGGRRRALRLQRAARGPRGQDEHDPARGLKDSLAVGASAIGQDKDLATPLEMASVGATIANRASASPAGRQRTPASAW